MRRGTIRLLTLVLLAALLALPGSLVSPRPLSEKAAAPTAWVELGPSGAIARLITQESACPDINFPSGSYPMQPRGQPAEDYPLLVCEAGIPPDTASAAVEGIALPVPKPHPQRVVVFGDTGCRLQQGNGRELVQDCNDPAVWPAQLVAASAAAWKPDLIIHVGDYLYREAPCPATNSGCAGSPWGYNWASWDADFFVPEAALLSAAPWVFVRGNHEVCERAGEGWFRFLDPRPLTHGCENYSEPYAVSAGDLPLLVFDSANADDFRAVPSEVAIYARQFEALNALDQPNSWLLTHRPLWVLGAAEEGGSTQQLFRDNPTLQAASQNQLPPGVSLVLSGHIHLFEALGFDGARPPQLIVGDGGTALDPNITTSLTGMQIAGATIQNSAVVDKFGFMTIERAGDGSTATLRDVAGKPLLDCSLDGGGVTCSQASRSGGRT